MKHLSLFIVLFIIMMVFASVLVHFSMPVKATSKAESVYTNILSTVKQGRLKKCKCCKMHPELSTIVRKYFADRKNISRQTPSTSK